MISTTTQIVVVQGDNLPNLYVMLYDRGTQKPLDLTDKDVTAKFKERGETSIVFSQPCDPAPEVGASVTKMAWPSDSLNVDPGTYELEFSMYDGENVQTAWPNIKVKVKEQFGSTTILTEGLVSVEQAIIENGYFKIYKDGTEMVMVVGPTEADAVEVQRWGAFT